jgi:hypothetical protein
VTRPRFTQLSHLALFWAFNDPLRCDPGDLPSLADRARPGSKHHLTTDGQGIPLAVSLTLFADRAYGHDKYRRLSHERGQFHGTGLRTFRWHQGPVGGEHPDRDVAKARGEPVDPPGPMGADCPILGRQQPGASVQLRRRPRHDQGTDRLLHRQDDLRGHQPCSRKSPPTGSQNASVDTGRSRPCTTSETRPWPRTPLASAPAPHPVRWAPSVAWRSVSSGQRTPTTLVGCPVWWLCQIAAVSARMRCMTRAMTPAGVWPHDSRGPARDGATCSPADLPTTHVTNVMTRNN